MRHTDTNSVERCKVHHWWKTWLYGADDTCRVAGLYYVKSHVTRLMCGDYETITHPSFSVHGQHNIVKLRLFFIVLDFFVRFPESLDEAEAATGARFSACPTARNLEPAGVAPAGRNLQRQNKTPRTTGRPSGHRRRRRYLLWRLSSRRSQCSSTATSTSENEDGSGSAGEDPALPRHSSRKPGRRSVSTTSACAACPPPCNGTGRNALTSASASAGNHQSAFPCQAAIDNDQSADPASPGLVELYLLEFVKQGFSFSFFDITEDRLCRFQQSNAKHPASPGGASGAPQSPESWPTPADIQSAVNRKAVPSAKQGGSRRTSRATVVFQQPFTSHSRLVMRRSSLYQQKPLKIRAASKRRVSEHPLFAASKSRSRVPNNFGPGSKPPQTRRSSFTVAKPVLDSPGKRGLPVLSRSRRGTLMARCSSWFITPPLQAIDPPTLHLRTHCLLTMTSLAVQCNFSQCCPLEFLHLIDLLRSLIDQGFDSPTAVLMNSSAAGTHSRKPHHPSKNHRRPSFEDDGLRRSRPWYHTSRLLSFTAAECLLELEENFPNLLINWVLPQHSCPDQTTGSAVTECPALATVFHQLRYLYPSARNPRPSQDVLAESDDPVEIRHAGSATTSLIRYAECILGHDAASCRLPFLVERCTVSTDPYSERLVSLCLEVLRSAVITKGDPSCPTYEIHSLYGQSESGRVSDPLITPVLSVLVSQLPSVSTTLEVELYLFSQCFTPLPSLQRPSSARGHLSSLHALFLAETVRTDQCGPDFSKDVINRLIQLGRDPFVPSGVRLSATTLVLSYLKCAFSSSGPSAEPFPDFRTVPEEILRHPGLLPNLVSETPDILFAKLDLATTVLSQLSVWKDNPGTRLSTMAEDAILYFTAILGCIKACILPALYVSDVYEAVSADSQVTALDHPVTARILLWDSASRGLARREDPTDASSHATLDALSTSPRLFWPRITLHSPSQQPLYDVSSTSFQPHNAHPFVWDPSTRSLVDCLPSHCATVSRPNDPAIQHPHGLGTLTAIFQFLFRLATVTPQLFLDIAATHLVCRLYLAAPSKTLAHIYRWFSGEWESPDGPTPIARNGAVLHPSSLRDPCHAVTVSLMDDFTEAFVSQCTTDWKTVPEHLPLVPLLAFIAPERCLPRVLPLLLRICRERVSEHHGNGQRARVPTAFSLGVHISRLVLHTLQKILLHTCFCGPPSRPSALLAPLAPFPGIDGYQEYVGFLLCHHPYLRRVMTVLYAMTEPPFPDAFRLDVAEFVRHGIPRLVLDMYDYRIAHSGAPSHAPVRYDSPRTTYAGAETSPKATAHAAEKDFVAVNALSQQISTPSLPVHVFGITSSQDHQALLCHLRSKCYPVAGDLHWITETVPFLSLRKLTDLRARGLGIRDGCAAIFKEPPGEGLACRSSSDDRDLRLVLSYLDDVQAYAAGKDPQHSPCLSSQGVSPIPRRIQVPIELRFVTPKSNDADHVVPHSCPSSLYSLEVSFSGSDMYGPIDPTEIPYLSSTPRAGPEEGSVTASAASACAVDSHCSVLSIKIIRPFPTTVFCFVSCQDEQGTLYFGRLDPFSLDFQDYFLPVSLPARLRPLLFAFLHDPQQFSADVTRLSSQEPSPYLGCPFHSVRVIEVSENSGIVAQFEEWLGPFATDIWESTGHLGGPKKENGSPCEMLSLQSSQMDMTIFDFHPTPYDFATGYCDPAADDEDPEDIETMMAYIEQRQQVLRGENPAASYAPSASTVEAADYPTMFASFLHQDEGRELADGCPTSADDVSLMRRRALFFVPPTHHVLLEFRIAATVTVVHIATSSLDLLSFTEDFVRNFDRHPRKPST